MSRRRPHRQHSLSPFFFSLGALNEISNPGTDIEIEAQEKPVALTVGSVVLSQDLEALLADSADNSGLDADRRGSGLAVERERVKFQPAQFTRTAKAEKDAERCRGKREYRLCGHR
jgi:hypothetical protein